MLPKPAGYLLIIWPRRSSTSVEATADPGLWSLEAYNEPGGSTVAVSIPRRLFTVDEYYEMARVGILKPDERVELLDGEIVKMCAIGSPHAWCVKRPTRTFYGFDDRYLISVQDPLRLDRKSTRLNS